MYNARIKAGLARLWRLWSTREEGRLRWLHVPRASHIHCVVPSRTVD